MGYVFLFLPFTRLTDAFAGDAPVHSIAVGLFLKPEEVHFFQDIGCTFLTLSVRAQRADGTCADRHEPFQHCPKNKADVCACDPCVLPLALSYARVLKRRGVGTTPLRITGTRARRNGRWVLSGDGGARGAHDEGRRNSTRSASVEWGRGTQCMFKFTGTRTVQDVNCLLPAKQIGRAHV